LPEIWVDWGYREHWNSYLIRSTSETMLWRIGEIPCSSAPEEDAGLYS